MARFLKWLLSLFVTTHQMDTDGDRPERYEALAAQLRIDAVKCEKSRQLLKRLDG